MRNRCSRVSAATAQRPDEIFIVSSECDTMSKSVNNGKSISRFSSGSRQSSLVGISALTTSMESAEAFDVGDTKVQHYGLLMKKPFGHKSGRWQKRFFIVKEGFLLYYPESENKAFERAHIFNIHPKGVIPLGGCEVLEEVNGPQKFAIKITHAHFKGEIWLGADNQEESSEWAEVLRDAGKVTWRNAQFGEKVIIQMEEKSRSTAAQLKEAIDDLNEKASVLEEEKGKKSELEELAAKLEVEKKAVEDAAKSLREEKDTVQQELQQTLQSVSTIQQEKESLFKATEELQVVLQTVSQEKEKTTAELQEREILAREMEEEKQQLEEATSHLKAGLISMEERQRALEEEKKTTVKQLRTQEETAKQLESENRMMSDAAQNLEANLKQVVEEKQTTESKWKEERLRRIKTEKRLRLAEDSLRRLDRALKESGVQIDLQIETDVKNLKKFFEDCIAEEQFEAKRLDIMRDAVRAKATYNLTSQEVENREPTPEPPPAPADASSIKPLSDTQKSNAAENGEAPIENASVADTGGERSEADSTAATTCSSKEETGVVANGGVAGNATVEGSEAVANGDAIGEGSEVIANGDAGGEVVANGHGGEANEANSETVPPECGGVASGVDKGESGGSGDTVENGVPSSA